MKKNIYFNTVVSQYFNVHFNNTGDRTNLIASTVLSCPIVSWDIDTRKTLASLEDQEITLLGKGSGQWEIFIDQVVQNKPDTDKWNNPKDDDPQEDNGKSESKKLDDFLKSVNMLFI